MADYDPTSYSDPRVAQIAKINIDWTVDFDSHSISGNVELEVKVKEENVKILVSLIPFIPFA